MGKVKVSQLVQSFEEAIGYPYVSPGTNDSRGIDCSGMFVRAYRKQGASIYHGSNTIWRKYMGAEKGKLTSVKQLKIGFAVFKWKDRSTQKWQDGQGDFHHIGLVTSLNPLRIVHASTTGMVVRVDNSIKNWTHYGALKDVAYDAVPSTTVRPDSITGDKMKQYKVVAKEGSTVNLRTRANKDSGIQFRVPIGEIVTQRDKPEEKWIPVQYKNWKGYMMSEFLEEI